MPPPEPGQAAGEFKQIRLLCAAFPVDPGQFIVLAVGIVIAPLRPAHFIAGQYHRNSLRAEQRDEEIPDLPGPELIDGWVIGGALRPAIGRPVVIRAITAVLAVGLIVLPLVADQVMQRKAVVAGDEID